MFTAYTYLADMLERLAGFNGQWVGWSMMAFGAIGMLGNWAGGRLADRSALGATLLFAAMMTAALAALGSAMQAPGMLAVSLGIWGIAQAGLFVVCHVRVMKSAPSAPAFAASLNISGANIGIGLGAMAGGYVIDHFGLAKLGLAAAGLVVAAMAVGLLLAVRPRRATQRPARTAA
jgi:DHA1 family inner membrane transport protein